MLSDSRALRAVFGAVASSLGEVAVARRSRRRCLRHRAGAPTVDLVVPPRSRRRGARPPLFRGSGSLLARCVVPSGPHSLRVVVGVVASSLGAVAVARRPRRRCPRRRARAPGAAQLCRRARCEVALGRRCWVVAVRSLGAARSAQRLVHFACGRRRGRFLSGSGRRRAALTAPLPTARSAALALLAPAQSCRRARGGVMLGRCSSASAARNPGADRVAWWLALSACGRWHGRFLTGGGRRSAALTAPVPAAPRSRSYRRLSRSCNAALALLAPAQSRRRARGNVTLGRRSSVVVVCSFGEVCSAQRLALFACGRRRGRFLPGGGRRRAALTEPLPAARGAALALLAPAQSCRRGRGGVTLGRFSFASAARSLARRVVLGGSRSLRAVVVSVASSLEAVAVARRS